MKITMTMDLNLAASMVNDMAILAATRRNQAASPEFADLKAFQAYAANTTKVAQAALEAYNAGALSNDRGAA